MKKRTPWTVFAILVVIVLLPAISNFLKDLLAGVHQMGKTAEPVRKLDNWISSPYSQPYNTIIHFLKDWLFVGLISPYFLFPVSRFIRGITRPVEIITSISHKRFWGKDVWFGAPMVVLLGLYAYVHLVLWIYGFIPRSSGVSDLNNPARLLISTLPWIALMMVAVLLFIGLAMWLFPRGRESVRKEGGKLFRCALYYVLPGLILLLIRPRMGNIGASTVPNLSGGNAIGIAAGSASKKDRLMVLSETGYPLMGYALEGPLSLLAGMPVKMTGPQTGQTMKAYLEKNPGTQADLVIAKSLNQLEVLSAKGLLEKNTIVLRIYRTPCIMVPKGNPKNIRGLNDLLKPGMRLEISDADRMEIGRMTRIMLNNKYLKQDRLDAVIDWTDIVMVNSKCWRADIDIVEIAPEKTMYEILYLTLFQSTPNRGKALGLLNSMQTPRGVRTLDRNGFGILWEPAPERIFE